ncbi:G-protein coupled receptor GRL101 [Portunus trituberculatus]|uniref:G-protein coupled receptor GRL101 n=1 Tax=Portunus trituberculatus TaxID=210409 RepID=A0A5B7JNK1_PORTR|nr:G-protein coupled receptor GRL101 [Portunus trituberculatus]
MYTSPSFRNFYGRSGVCLALHITHEKPNGWQYSVFVFLGKAKLVVGRECWWGNYGKLVRFGKGVHEILCPLTIFFFSYFSSA